MKAGVSVPNSPSAAAGACFADARDAAIADCGHNMHHDRPAEVAGLIEEFFA